MNEQKLSPCQQKAKKEIFKKINFLGVRSNLLIIGQYGVGKTFLGKHLDKKEDFQYVNLIENDWVKKQEFYIKNNMNCSDFINSFIKKRKSNSIKKLRGLIVDNIDPILLIYRKKGSLNSFLLRFFRSENNTPTILISSLENIFIDKRKKEKKFIDFLIEKYEQHIIHIEFEKEDSKFFSRKISLPISKYKNIYEIFLDKNQRRG